MISMAGFGRKRTTVAINMDDRLLKRWEITRSVLGTAASQIVETEHYDQYREYLDHNEFELALDVLEDAGIASNVNKEYWHYCKKAAEIMGLDRARLDRFRALKSAAPE